MWGEQLDKPLKWIRVRHVMAKSVIKSISGTSSETYTKMNLHQTQPASSSETPVCQECPPVLPSDQHSGKGRARVELTADKQLEEALKH